MSKIDIMLVVGARPQFIKSAPIVKEILSRHRHIDLTLVHSGQHYDPEMSEIFFRELEIPPPSVNLKAGSGSHATQTAVIMKRLESLMLETKPHVVMVPGDTNTTLAASLAAAKLAIPVAHVEAGLRSGDMTMPEEVNRIVADHCSKLLFAPTTTAVSNLKKEGLENDTYLTGDTMFDALNTVMPIVEQKKESVLERFGLQNQGYVLMTLHRPSNVDDSNKLREIHRALRKVAKTLRVVFPAHPRTRVALARLGILSPRKNDGMILTSPQGYVETVALLKDARCLLTDSGGMQKESFLLHVPCITLRSVTEWPETLAGNANRLLSVPEKIPEVVLSTAFDRPLRERIRNLRSPFGDGHAANRIVRILQRSL
jgi:UDP-N-acetylglucosamine 2-epimerase